MSFLDEARAEFNKARGGEPTAVDPRQRYEYDVVELREKLLDNYGSAPTRQAARAAERARGRGMAAQASRHGRSSGDARQARRMDG